MESSYNSCYYQFMKFPIFRDFQRIPHQSPPPPIRKYRAIDEIGTDIKLPTCSWVKFPIPGDSPCRSHSLAQPPICIEVRRS